MNNNENLPAHVSPTGMAEIGSITYANEVVAIIAGMAAAEIDGVAAMGAASSIVDLLGRKQKPVTKGVKVEVGSEEASVDLVFSVEYGKPIQRVCRDVQESVRKSIETMTGLHVVKVDVHVLGVSFEKESQMSAEYAQAANAALESGKGSTFGQVVRSRPLPHREDAAADGIAPEDKASNGVIASDDVDLPDTSIDMDTIGDEEDDGEQSAPITPDKSNEETVQEETVETQTVKIEAAIETEPVSDKSSEPITVIDEDDNAILSDGIL